MFSLYHSILLWSLNTRHLMFYAFERVKLMQIKFRSLIKPNAFDISRKLSFNQSNERFNVALYFWFSFQRKTQVCWKKSSTIVKIYLCPSTKVMANGPQISICNKSKNLLLEEVLTGNGSHLCLASGHFWQKPLHVLLEM